MFSVIIILGIVIFITHFLEGITGFGCTIMAMPFAIMLVGLSVGRPVLTIFGFLLCFYITVISYKNIDWKILRYIIIGMGIGLPIGMAIYSYLPELILKRTLAVFMLLISVRGILLSYGKFSFKHKLNNKVLNAFLLLGGIIHGAFTSGGPFVIIYAIEKLKDKTVFRATLCAMWTLMNGILIIQQIITNQINSEVLNVTLWTSPFLVLGVIGGNWAHYKIKDKYFTKLSYIVLLVSAVFMII